MSSRRVSGVNSRVAVFKSCLLAYSACSEFSVGEDYSDFEFLFLNNTKIPDYWNSAEIMAEDWLKNILDQYKSMLQRDSLNTYGLGMTFQNYLTGEPMNLIQDDDGNFTDFERTESEEFIQYLDIWKQFCRENDVDWIYND